MLNRAAPVDQEPAGAPPALLNTTLPLPGWRFIDVVIIGLGSLAGTLAAILASQAITRSLEDAGRQPSGFASPVVVLLAIQAATMVLAVAALGMLRRRLGWPDVGLRQARWWWLVAAAAVAMFLLPVRLGLGYLVQMVVDPDMQTIGAANEAIFIDTSLPGMLLVTLLGGLAVPFAEELFFRGVVYPWLRTRLGTWPSVLISSAVFALAHGYLPTVLAAFVIAVPLAWTYERSRSLWVPVTIHMVNNMVVFVMAFAALALSEYLGLPT
jgi:hypothetical protein